MTELSKGSKVGEEGEFHLPVEESKLVPPPAPDIFQDVEVRMTVEGAIEYASASSERVIDLEQRLAVCCGRLMACLFCTTTVMGFDRTPQIAVVIEKGECYLLKEELKLVPVPVLG